MVRADDSPWRHRGPSYFSVRRGAAKRPLFAGGFGGWDYWDTGSDFVTHYTGRVIANLADPEGKHIRCKFQLVHPSNGMAGGGEGGCQLPDGKTIDASFPGAS